MGKTLEVRVVETDRLDLRPWTRGAADRAAFVALCADPEVMRWTGDGSPLGPGAARAVLDRVVRHWEDRGFGLWAMRPLGADADVAPVGYVGLAVPAFLPAVLPAVEVGWRLRREAWGSGLATEGGRAALAWARERGREPVVSIVRPENERSCRVAERLGLRAVRELMHPQHGYPVRLYEDPATRGASAASP
jgi:RimJ/RimL family protein N-acetyltransferase